MRKHILREFWSFCILCLITQANVYALAEKTILQEIQAKVSPQQVTQNALSREIPADDIVIQLVEAGLKPIDAAKVVAKAAPQDAVAIAVTLVQLTPDLAEHIAGAVVRSVQIATAQLATTHSAEAIPTKMALEVAIAVARIVTSKRVPNVAASVAKIVPHLAVEIVRELSLLAPQFAREIADAVIAAIGDSLDKNKKSEILKAVVRASVLPTTEPVTADRISVSPSRNTQPDHKNLR